MSYGMMCMWKCALLASLATASVQPQLGDSGAAEYEPSEVLARATHILSAIEGRANVQPRRCYEWRDLILFPTRRMSNTAESAPCNRLFVDVTRVLTEIRIIPPQYGIQKFTIEKQYLEYDECTYSVTPWYDPTAAGGAAFVAVDMRLIVAQEPDEARMNLLNLAVREAMAIPIAADSGMFSPDQQSLGDACFTRGGRNIGFCRGNVVLEIHVLKTIAENGRLKPVGTDPDMQAKLVDAARRIDDLLLERMFTEPVRQRIRTAERQRWLAALAARAASGDAPAASQPASR